MASVIQRFGHTVHQDGAIEYDDQPSTFEAADLLAGHRVDRRRNYAIVQGELCEACEFTDTCSGCEGNGCSECGYQGRRRQSHWVPHAGCEVGRAVEREERF